MNQDVIITCAVTGAAGTAGRGKDDAEDTQLARWMLQQTSQSVTDISVACGFASLSHFTRSYQQRFDKSPSRER